MNWILAELWVHSTIASLLAKSIKSCKNVEENTLTVYIYVLLVNLEFLTELNLKAFTVLMLVLSNLMHTLQLYSLRVQCYELTSRHA